LARALTTLGGLLRKKIGVNVRQNTTLGDGDVTKELVQFFVIADGQLKMAWDDTSLLVVTSGIASQFENFCCEVLKYGGEVDGST
jgi:hypothetical protein